MYNNKFIKFIRSVKFEIKYFFRNYPFKRQINRFITLKKSHFYRWMFNFILTEDFMKQFNQGEVRRNIFDYGIDLFTFEDCEISCFANCAFVHKFVGKTPYALKESAGINRRVDEDGITFGRPINLRKNVTQEDEVCPLCFSNGMNYWHFTLDVLTKIMIMEKLGYKGKYLVNADGSSKEFLELLGFPEDRIIFCGFNKVIHAKRVYMFDECYGIDLGGKWLDDTRQFIVDRIQERHGSLIDENSPKRIYVSRIGTRRIINENQLIDYLKPHGFEVIVPEKYSILEQIKLFANVDILVTPHGANSTNVLYSKKGTTFVECFGHYWVNPCMVTTVDLLDLDYHMICERFMHNIPNSGSSSNYIIDITIFKCIMKKIFEHWDLKNSADLKK